MRLFRRSDEGSLREKGRNPMKRLPQKSDRKADGRGGEIPPATTEAFAENRYLKYRFQRESIELRAPESSGVYGLFNAFWIYIGEDENIRTRLLEHLTDDNPRIKDHQPSGFAFELVSPEDRCQRREQLIKELEPICSEDLPHLGPSADAGPDVSDPAVDALASNQQKSSFRTGR